MVASNEQIYITMGCFGRQDDGFVSCNGLENRILRLDLSLDNYNKLMEYLEGCRLFDKPMFDVNASRHFIYHLQNSFDQKFKPLWSEKKFRLFEKFLLDHRMCGTYVKLILVNTDFEEKIELEPAKVFIKGSEEPLIQPRIRRIK